MVITISGRKQSGKTELANICVKHGFIKLAIADSLKNLVCILLGVNREHLNINKESPLKFKASEEHCEILSEHLPIELEDIRNLFLNREFVSIRELLQYLGTDIIRLWCPNWHIDKLLSLLDKEHNYVIDDVRFPNEKQALDSIGAESFFIIRPGWYEYSNHSSEIALNWTNFENVLINDRKLSLFVKKWERLITAYLYPHFNRKKVKGFTSKLDLRRFLQIQFKLGKSTQEIATELICSRDKIVWWADKLFLNVNRETYLYNERAFLEPTAESAYLAGLLCADGCIKFSSNKLQSRVSFTSTDLELIKRFCAYCGNKPYQIIHRKAPHKDAYEIDICSPYIIENLKRWNILPCKSMNEKIPDILRGKIDMLKYWIVGLIDGDGTIYTVTKTNYLVLQILASDSICQYLHSIIPCYHTGPHLHKKHLSLYELRFHGKYAVLFSEWLDYSGLIRKWDKINQYKQSLIKNL